MRIQAKPCPKSTILPLRVVALTLCAVLALSAQTPAQKIVSFDAPHSSSGYLQGTAVWGINAQGAITGDVTDSTGATHGYVRTPEGKFFEFDAPGANPSPGYGCEYSIGGTCPSAINDHGAVTGWSQDANGAYHGFVRSPDGKLTVIDIAEAGVGSGQGTHAMGINNWGVITGFFVDSNNVLHGFLRSPGGSIVILNDPAAGTGAYEGTLALSINDFGAVAGVDTDANNFTHGFMRTADGKFNDFDPPGTLGNAYGVGNALINDRDVIAGTYFQGIGNIAYGYQRNAGGKIVDYQAPTAGTAQFAGASVNALNVRGTAVGYVEDANYESRSFIRDADGRITVFAIPGQLFATGSSYGSGAFAINEDGVVAGRWYDANWTIHGWVLLPKDR